MKLYRDDRDNFKIGYNRQISNNRIKEETEEIMKEELAIDRGLIEDTDVPIYNYSYIREQLKQKHSIEVSVLTIISRRIL